MEIKVIKKILYSPRIKQKELAEDVGASVSTVQRIIKKLVKEEKDSSYEWKTEWVLESLVECLLSWMMEL
ncbi:MAG: winged helix-turn-helix domain-containing protein [Gallintestinimicrobium sp.]